VVTLFQPGTSVWHRLPAGPKAAVLAVVVLAVSVLPAAGWWVAGAAAVAALACYGVPGIGVRTLARQAWAARWLLLVTATGQLVFQGPQHAVVNTARVAAVITVAALLALTTPVSDLLDALERGMSPLRRLGVDPASAALLMSITLTAIPALARTAAAVREAQRARGCRASLRLFAVPFLVGALKHADELGDALTARGVR
jgi:biotin transport system permease protein